MKEIPFTKVQIKDDFWSPRLKMNATHALLHQWQQLENSGCIQNFRLVVDKSTPGFRQGWFFADSDAYKWLEAAVSGYAQYPEVGLPKLINDFISLIESVQAADGYIYTYNQLIFPESRWENLQIEHELYCHGHLIEAAVSHFQVTGEESFLAIGIKAADLIVQTFYEKGSLYTPGHEEIEIALLRLFEVTHNESYLHMAQQFLEQRGKHKPLAFSLHMLGENQRVNQRNAIYKQKQTQYTLEHPEITAAPKLSPPNKIKSSQSAKLRFTLSALVGKYFQQHQPVIAQTCPVGHAVRFAYLQTAAAKYSHLSAISSWLPTLQRSWDHMVSKRMAVTGGIGSLPYSEGFGRDFELDPELMYAETCAALGSMFWNWEMSLLTQEAAYADLFEWQLYNASLVGIGHQGDCYLYNNPLQSMAGMQRQPWYEIPCCPSNLSRTWAKLGGYLCSYQTNEICIQQFVGSEIEIPFSIPIQLKSESELPWQGQYKLRIHTAQSQPLKINLRIPSWAGRYRITINQKEWLAESKPTESLKPTAHGYDPRLAQYICIDCIWHDKDVLTLELDMPIQVQRVHSKVKSCSGKAALSRGPIVYCMEGVDQPDLDLMNVIVDPTSLFEKFEPDFLGGIMTLEGRTTTGKPIKLIPYAWWANRETSPMTVFVRLSK